MAVPMSMAPPGFSLRVKLFSPNAHGMNDQALRSFRIVTSPELTIGEFCQQASRFYETNYGEPIAIKRVQDDAGFDIDQTSVIGDLFVNIATVRIVQAIANVGVRDSLPPSSGLRFDPANYIGRKREREGIAKPNNSPSPGAYRPNKRQRISDLDPDQPLPSRELDSHAINEGSEQREEIIPNSQREAVNGISNGDSRLVRDDRQISETPSPPAEQSGTSSKNSSADPQDRKSVIPDTNDLLTSQMSIPSPFGPASNHAQNHGRSKSVNHHIQRATDGGRSISTAATSPLSVYQQGGGTNGITISNPHKISDPSLEMLKVNGRPSSGSPNVESVYEDFPSDSERSSILSRTKEKLRPKNGSPAGLPGLDWAKKFNTPPNGNRHSSRARDRAPSNGGLPLTPDSKETQRQNELANAAKVAATQAADQQLAEDRERTQQMRQEKSEHDAQEKMNVIATAKRLERDRIAQLGQDQKLETARKAAEDRHEQQKIQKEALVQGKYAMLPKRQQEQEYSAQEDQVRLVQEKVRAEESERLRDEESKIRAETKSAEPSQKSTTSKPTRPKTPAIRPSSTPFIPSGRKPALKAPPSQLAQSSSPSLARSVSWASSTTSQDDLRQGESERQVDENLNERTKATSMKPPPILPPSRLSISRLAANITPKKPTVAPESTTAIQTPILPPVRQSTTPIPPPSFKKTSKEQSTTPAVQHSNSSTHSGVSEKPVSAAIPRPSTTSILPLPRSVSREASHSSIKSKESTKATSSPTVHTAASFSADADEIDKSREEAEDEDGRNTNDSSDDNGTEGEDDADLDVSSRVDPVQALNSSVRVAASRAKAEEKSASGDDENLDVNMQDIQSNRSSTRSPIQFNSHATPSARQTAQSVGSATSVSETTNDDVESMDEVNSADEESSDVEEAEETEVIAETNRCSPPRSYATEPTIASPAVKSTSSPALSSITRPRFAIGASLSDMNAKKTITGSSSQTTKQQRPLKLAEEDDEESEEESGAESSNSDDEEVPSQILPKLTQPHLSVSNGFDSVSSGSDGDSNSDEEHDDIQKHQDELSEQINKMFSESQVSTQSCNDIPSPKLPKNSQSSTSSSGAKERESSQKQKRGVFLFSRPKFL